MPSALELCVLYCLLFEVSPVENSSLITHVEVDNEPLLREKAALISFMADMLGESDHLRTQLTT